MVLGIGLTVAACSVAQTRGGFDDDDDGTADGGATTPDTDAQGGINADVAPRCKGLECLRAECEPGAETSLSGTVYTPNGEIPLYNVIVYIPGSEDAELPEITHGATCDRCGATALSPLVSTLTDEKGEFTLKNVPVGENIPVVIQVGKWRRTVEIEIPDACQKNEVDDGDLHLPRNQDEGSLPKIAVAMGVEDPLQCLLSRIGVDESEFTRPGDSGMIHLFDGGSSLELDGASVPAASSDLWSNETQLMDYDMVLLACTGNTTRRQSVQANMDAYLNAGGRVFATHYQALWFQDDSAASGVAQWGGTTFASGTHQAEIDKSFPKGEAFASWLDHVDALQSDGRIQITEIGDSVRSPNSDAQRWIYTSSYTQFMTFNTPVGVPEDQQCGRAVVSDIHVSDASGTNFMSSCGSGALSAQEKALLFLIMDLSSCVQNDEDPPVPPPN